MSYKQQKASKNNSKKFFINKISSVNNHFQNKNYYK